MLFEIKIPSDQIQFHLDMGENFNITHLEWNPYTNPTVSVEYEVMTDMKYEIDSDEYGFVDVDKYNELQQQFDELSEEFDELKTKYENLLRDNTKVISDKLQLSVELEQLKNNKKPFWRFW